MTSTYYTEDLSDFGTREFKILKDILNAWFRDGLPNGFYSYGIRPAMNTSSGYVFLVNHDHQVAMMNSDRLEIHHCLPSSLKEGFLSDLMTEYSPDSLDEEDQDFILQNAKEAGLELNTQWRGLADLNQI
jgi:hypothetical protein